MKMADVPEWEPRVRVLEEIAAATKDALNRIDARFEHLDGKMTAGFDRLDGKITRLDEKRERDFRVLFGAIIVTTIGLAALIARTQHWI
jgi:hypothetical protein